MSEANRYFYYDNKYIDVNKLTYQVVAYSWDHWANKEISRVTGAEINHVAIRFNPLKLETYVSHKKTDVLVPSKVVTRKHGKPVWKGPKVKADPRMYVNALKWTQWWADNEPGNIWRPYFHHYIGRHLGLQSPWTCTKLCKLILNEAGVEIDHDFYPSEFIKEYIREVY